jgi:hypothetical protein
MCKASSLRIFSTHGCIRAACGCAVVFAFVFVIFTGSLLQILLYKRQRGAISGVMPQYQEYGELALFVQCV